MVPLPNSGATDDCQRSTLRCRQQNSDRWKSKEVNEIRFREVTDKHWGCDNHECAARSGHAGPNQRALPIGRMMRKTERSVRRLRLCLGIIVSIQAAAATGSESGHAETEVVATPAITAAQQQLPSWALDTLVVSATKRPVKNSDIPQSVTVFNLADMQAFGTDGLSDLAFRVPNLNLVEFSAQRLSFPFIRGIGSGQRNPAVGMVIDDIPQFSINTFNIEFLDIERVEFLRGPQSTLSGRHTLGGAIAVFTRQPSDTPTTSATADIGTAGLQRYRLSLTRPINDSAAFGVSAGYMTRDGYTKNEITGNLLDDREAVFGRATVVLRPPGDVAALIAVTGQHDQEGPFVPTDLTRLRSRNHRVRYDFEGESNRDIVSPSLKIDVFGHAVDFTSISGLVRWESDSASDFDFSEFDAVRRFVREEESQYTQEFRMLSPPDQPLRLSRDVTVDWLIGLLVFYNDFEQNAATDLRLQSMIDNTGATLTDRGAGAYGEATVQIGTKIDVAVGLRYEIEDKRADLVNVLQTAGGNFVTLDQRLDDTYDAFAPRLSLSWSASPFVQTYLSAAKGFRSGGFNGRAPAGQIPFDPETSWTYEAGVKASWLDKRLTVNAALFQISWDDMQLFLVDQNTGGFYTENAGESESRGFEVECRLSVTEHLDIIADLGVLDTEFREFIDPFTGDASGKSLPFAPDYTWRLAIDKSTEINANTTLFARIELVGTGAFEYDAGNTAAQDDFVLVNLRIGAQYQRWLIEGWARNLFDTDYVPVAFQLPNNAFVGESGPPQTFGVTVRCNF